MLTAFTLFIPLSALRIWESGERDFVPTQEHGYEKMRRVWKPVQHTED
jgi:hypothetical protein